MCNIWYVGRVMLAGDSALFFPPFGVQGIQSGFMDSSDLAWGLIIALLRNYELRRLFESWSMELKQQIGQALAYAV